MKKLKRIICIVLVLICLCMQGCFNDFIMSCSNGFVQSKCRSIEKILQYQKKDSDSVKPEISGYKLRIQRKSESDNINELIQNGFFEYENTEFYFDNISARMTVKENSAENETIIITIYSTDKEINYGAILKEIIISEFKVTKEKTKILFDLFPIMNPIYRIIDEKVFIIVNEMEINDMNLWYSEYSVAPAIYLLDIENEDLLYLGYAESYYDEIRKNNYRELDSSNFYFKIENQG